MPCCWLICLLMAVAASSAVLASLCSASAVFERRRGGDVPCSSLILAVAACSAVLASPWRVNDVVERRRGRTTSRERTSAIVASILALSSATLRIRISKGSRV